MCEIVERYARQCVQEAEREIAGNLFKNGTDYELVRKSITSLSDEELKRIYDEALVA